MSKTKLSFAIMKIIKTTTPAQAAKRISMLYSGSPELFRKPIEKAGHKIALPTLAGINFEKIEEIVSLEAKGNYTWLHFLNNKKVLVCKTLREMEFSLRAENQFVRVHRSFTINLKLLHKYIKGKGGYVIMEDQSVISVSAGRKQEFMKALERFFGF